MDRASEKLQEQQYFADRAADAMLHLDRARKALMRARANRREDFTDYGSMSDYLHYLGQAQLIIREFQKSKVETPEYLSREWVAVVQGGR